MGVLTEVIYRGSINEPKPLKDRLGTHVETDASLTLEVIESFVEYGELHHVLVPIVCGY